MISSFKPDSGYSNVRTSLWRPLAAPRRL